MNICGIYIICNKVNNKKYVGSSIKNKERLIAHKSLLRLNKHYNKHLQYSYNFYSESNFEFYTIEECKKEKLVEREQYYINKFNTLNCKYGYNLTNANRSIWTKEHRQKRLLTISKWSKSRRKIWIHKLSIANKGKKLSDQTKQKISNAKKGFIPGGQWRINNSLSHIGHKHSKETRQKMSNTRNSVAYLEKIKLKNFIDFIVLFI